jgi:uncharacterized membrane protein
MSSFVVYEAVIIGLKEGFKIGIVWVVFYSYLHNNKSTHLIRPFYIGLLSVLIVSVGAFLLPHGYISKQLISNSISTSLAVLLILSCASLFQASGLNLFGPFARLLKWRTAQSIVVFIVTFMFFFTDSTGAVFFLRDLSLMKEAFLAPYASVGAGLLIACIFLILVMRYVRPFWIGTFFEIPQLLLFLAIVKLLAGGIQGFAELSLIPSVQRGFIKFSHDVMHQTLVMLMVPDHPLLTTTAWNFIGFFFGSNFAHLISLVMLLGLPVLFIYFSLFLHLPEPETQSRVERRKLKALIMSDRRRKSIPVFIFIIIVLVSWFSHGAETPSRLYNPQPKPVVAEKGIVIIPLKDPTADIMDGSLHKFSVNLEGEKIRLMVIRKSNGELAVCLDACEICPPEGYGQREKHVICIYCNTPIPVDTLGEAGGCNPIPVAASVDDRSIRIEASEILRKWRYVKTGESKKAIKDSKE